MIAWVLAVTVIGVLLLLVAMGADTLCAHFAVPRRGAWMLAMIAMCTLPVIMSRAAVRQQSLVGTINRSTPTAPDSLRARAQVPRLEIQSDVAPAGPTAPIAPRAASPVTAQERLSDVESLQFPTHLDRVLLISWAIVSVALGLCVLRAGFQLRRLRSRWTSAPPDVQAIVHVHCSPRTMVWSAASSGPAAFGIVRAQVVIPEWAATLSEPERTLLLMHEASHVRARDPLLLRVALTLVIVLPWHLPLLVAYRRLHRAIEQDCDRRVVARTGAARAYGRLLLSATTRVAKPSRTPSWTHVVPWLPAPMPGIGTRRSELEMRLSALVPAGRTMAHRVRATCVGVATLATMVAACAVPTPRLALSSSAPIEVIVRTAADTVATIANVSMRASAAVPPVVLTHAGAGRYTGTLPDSVRGFELTILVPEHERLQTTVMRPAGDVARFSLRLRRIIPRRVAENPRVIGDFNGFDVNTAVPLRAGVDGVLRAAIPYRGDASRVQILGVGTRGTWMPIRTWALSPALPDLIPRWAGVITPRRDTLYVAIDTAGRRPDSRAPTITTEPVDSTASAVNALVLARNDTWVSEQALNEWTPDREQRLRATTRASARSTLVQSRDPVVRAHALVTLLAQASKPNPDLRNDSRLFFELVKAGSSLTYGRDGLMAVETAMSFARPDSGAPARDTLAWHRQIAERVRSYVIPVARAVTVDSMQRKNAWLTTLYQLDVVKDPQIDEFIEEALAAYPTDPILATFPQAMGTRRTLRVGASFPSFRLSSIGDPPLELSNATFSGKLTLVDFWGTWCGPCIVEMPFLHRVHERFRDRGFTILSVASDESVDVVRKFRAGRWKMPWLNAWTEGSGNSKALQALGVVRFPMAVLVGPDGKVIAIDDGLRGDVLETTVERHLPR